MAQPATASLPRDQALALLDLAVAECYREVTRGSVRGCIHEENGLLLYAGGHPSPVIVNGAMRVADGAPARDILRLTEEFFAGRRHAYGITARAHGDADVERAALVAGWRPVIELPGLVLDHRLPDGLAADGSSVRQVLDDRGARDYATVIADAFADQEPDAAGLAASVFPDRRSLSQPQIAAFVAYVGDEPVAAAMVIVAYRVGFLQWVGTRRAFRRRGLGRAVTGAAVNAGFGRGAVASMLLTSPMGAPLYRGLGYRQVTAYRRWSPDSQVRPRV